MEIVIIHHHLHPGGVTRIIESLVNALANYQPAPEIKILAGSIPIEYHNQVPEAKVTEIPELNYLSEDLGNDPERLKQLNHTLKDRLKRHCSKSAILHIHNPNLGKNPVFTYTVYQLAQKYFQQYDPDNSGGFFEERAIVVPNTSSIEWDWKQKNWDNNHLVYPEQDNYNDSFLRDIGLLHEIEQRGFTLDDTILLLQHTRIVPRKKIELAIDLAFHLEQRYMQDGQKKCMAIIVSGHSGDEQEDYKKFLDDYFQLRMEEYPNANVVIIFGEKWILSHRDIIVDHKYYKFAEIPSIIC